jgi:hypothetical protein
MRRRTLLARAIAGAFLPLGLARADAEFDDEIELPDWLRLEEKTLVEIPRSPPPEPVTWAVDIGPGPDLCSFWGYVVGADGARRILFERTCRITRQGANDVLEVPLHTPREGVSLGLLTRGQPFSVGYRVHGDGDRS